MVARLASLGISMDKGAPILVTGCEAMIGSAIARRLKNDGFSRVLEPTVEELDLIDQRAVIAFFEKTRPAYVFLNSLKSGGIIANSRFPAEFIYLNIQSQANVIHSAWKTGVSKLLYLGSSCMYPKESRQPMKEEYLLTGKLEPTSEPYAIAKISGIRMCQAYRSQYGSRFVSAVPGDVYGPGDDFNPETGHVLAGLMSRMQGAKTRGDRSVTLWGSGRPTREFLYVDDLADACMFLMDRYEDPEMVNVGVGEETSIMALAMLMRETTGFSGELAFDTSKPDGIPRKGLDSTRINKLGWKAKTSLRTGLLETYDWFLRNQRDGNELPGEPGRELAPMRHAGKESRYLDGR